MSTWLLMMGLCLGPGNCDQVPIDEFPSQDECSEALARATAKQQLVKPGQVMFFCQMEGERRS
jgi:hypothetical protein